MMSYYNVWGLLNFVMPHPLDFREGYRRRLAGEPVSSMQSYRSQSHYMAPSHSVHSVSRRSDRSTRPPPSPLSRGWGREDMLAKGVGKTNQAKRPRIDQDKPSLQP